MSAGHMIPMHGFPRLPGWSGGMLPAARCPRPKAGPKAGPRAGHGQGRGPGGPKGPGMSSFTRGVSSVLQGNACSSMNSLDFWCFCEQSPGQNHSKTTQVEKSPSLSKFPSGKRFEVYALWLPIRPDGLPTIGNKFCAHRRTCSSGNSLVFAA